MTLHSEDLGALTGPVLLFGGPYSNLESTKALIKEAKRRDIPPGRVICTGDVVAYCADPLATVEAIRDFGCHVVMGNCEESLGLGGADCGCGFEKGGACDLLAVKWYAHADARMTDDAREWMRARPHPLTFTLAGFKLAAVHGHARDISEWIFASTPESEKRVALDQLDADGVIAGHSGLPFTQVLDDGRLWHNPGVIGMPANDGTPRVWYSVLEPMGGALRITHHALAYDHRTAIDKMAAEGLPDAYVKTMADGLWPNLDVLPTAESEATGEALDFEPVLWRRPRRDAA